MPDQLDQKSQIYVTDTAKRPLHPDGGDYGTRPLDSDHNRRSEEKGSTSGNENYGATKKDELADGVRDPKR